MHNFSRKNKVISQNLEILKIKNIYGMKINSTFDKLIGTSVDSERFSELEDKTRATTN